MVTSTSYNPLTLSFPLHGASLIEASAETGKTYTISSFYLRLVLGHHCTPLGVENIPLVTFTNAATNELKVGCKLACTAHFDFEHGHSSDPLVQALLTYYQQPEQDLRLAKQRLLVATQSMDNAAIFTIHGFCQRTLAQHAFESANLYEQT